MHNQIPQMDRGKVDLKKKLMVMMIDRWKKKLERGKERAEE